MKKIVACGCSFTHGLVLNNNTNLPYPNLVATKLNSNLVNLAIPGASNYFIAKQIEHSIKLKPDLVLIGVTTNIRFDFIKPGLLKTIPNMENFNLVDEHNIEKIISRSSSWFIENQKNNYFSLEHRVYYSEIAEYVLWRIDPMIKKDQDRLIILGSLLELEKNNIPYVVVDFDDTMIGITNNVISCNYRELNKKFSSMGDPVHWNQIGHHFIADKILDII